VTPTDGQAGRKPMAVRVTLQRGRIPGEAGLQWLISSCHRDDQSAGDAASGAAG
jgi:hypothetical protein